MKRLALPLGLASLVLLAAVAAAFSPDLRALQRREKSDNRVAIALDWEDLAAYAPRGDASAYFDRFAALPVAAVVADLKMPAADEAAIRGRHAAIVWKLDDAAVPGDLAVRFQPGDGALVTGEGLIDRPGVLEKTAALAHEKSGFVPILEFVPRKAFGALPRLAKDRAVRAHVLARREMTADRRPLWRARLVRAARERNIHFLLVHLASSLDADANAQFLKDVAGDLSGAGFVVSPVVPLPIIDDSSPALPVSDPFRVDAAFALAIWWPLVAAMVLAAGKPRSPFLLFALVTVGSMVAGTAISALGARPDIASGLVPYRGVKLQLILPLAGALLLLLTPEERRRWWRRPIQVRHVAGVGAAAAALLAFYVMRSGNGSLIPVSGAERSLRDALEAVFVARPRFKEFLIGHPLMVLGLYRRETRGEAAGFVAGGRLFIWLGLIGQISIVDSFCHFHIPYALTLLRSVHGFWLGGLLGIPLCYAATRRGNAAAGPAARRPAERVARAARRV